MSCAEETFVDHCNNDLKNGLKENSFSKFDKNEKRNIIKNAIVCTLAYFLLFTSFVGLSIIQSALNGTVGTIGLGVSFAASIFGCLALSPLFMKLLGCKMTMVIGFFGFATWMIANFHVAYYTIIPAAIINGLVFGPVFSAQAAYFTDLGLRFAAITKKNADEVISLFFGTFFCCLLLGTSFGCFLTSVIMNSGSSGGDSGNTLPGLIPFGLNETLSNSTTPALAQLNFDQTTMTPSLLPTDPQTTPFYGPKPSCGAGFCPIETNGTSVSPTPNSRIILLVSVHSAEAILAGFLILFFVDKEHKEQSNDEKSAWENVKSSITVTFKQIIRARQLAMTFLNIYSGMSQSFALADLTLAYIGCSLGHSVMGYALMTYGITSCIISLVCGFIMEKVGRVYVYTACFVIRFATITFLLVWVPDSSKTAVFYLIPSLWSIGDGVFLSQMNAMYGIMFSDNPEGAFSTYRFWEAVGMVIGYVYTTLICVSTKIYIQLVVFILGVIGYYIGEYMHKRYLETHRANDEAIDPDVEKPLNKSLSNIVYTVEEKESSM